MNVVSTMNRVSMHVASYGSNYAMIGIQLHWGFVSILLRFNLIWWYLDILYRRGYRKDEGGYI